MSGIHKNRRNMPLYARILAAVAREPKPAQQVSAELGVCIAPVRAALRFMRGKLVRVASYRPKDKGRAAALWLLGGEPDAPASPAVRRMELAMPRRSAGPEMICFLTAFEAMLHAPRSMRELEQMTGCGRGTLLRVIRDARELGVLHVGMWDRQRNAGAWAPCYAVAVDQPDRPKPPRKSRREIQRRYWKSRRAREQQLFIASALAANGAQFQPAAAAA